MKRFKKGAASFYVVAFSTLILLIVVTSFSALIISQVTRTTNDDLSQSAYDSALAGIEDAKLAFYKYRACLADGAKAVKPDNSGTFGCDNVVWVVENEGMEDCDAVSYILGRKKYGDENQTEVLIQESNEADAGNNMQQAYTCAMIYKDLDSYKSTLSSQSQMKVVKVETKDDIANMIDSLEISWQTTNADDPNWSNTNSGSQVTFTKDTPNPATLSIGILQAGDSFEMSSFESTDWSGDSGQTNKGTVLLVPTKNKTMAQNSNDGNYYLGRYNGSENVISKNDVLKSNDHTKQNLPYVVYCDESNKQKSDSFLCTARIDLPKPKGGVRSDDNFVVTVALPYGGPTTEFKMEFLCDGDCGYTSSGVAGETETSNRVILSGVQVEVEATGRANDMYRRVKARLETSDDFSLSLMGPLELLKGMEKDYTVTCEKEFSDGFGTKCTE